MSRESLHLQCAGNQHNWYHGQDEEGEDPGVDKGNDNGHQQADCYLKECPETGTGCTLDPGCIISESGGEGTGGVLLLVKPANLLT